MSGWVSNCKYTLDGTFQGTVQMISYEVSTNWAIVSFCLFVLPILEFVKDSKSTIGPFLHHNNY